MPFAFAVKLLLASSVRSELLLCLKSASESVSSRLPEPRFSGARSFRTKWRLHGPPRMGRAQP